MRVRLIRMQTLSGLLCESRTAKLLIQLVETHGGTVLLDKTRCLLFNNNTVHLSTCILIKCAVMILSIFLMFRFSNCKLTTLGATMYGKAIRLASN